MSYIGREPQVGNFQVCDAISVVNGQAAYTMQVNSVNVSPETANHMLVSLNGVLQAPGSSYTVSGSTITFASNLVTGDVINFIHILGSVLDLGVPSDSTVSLAKLTATGTKNSSTFLRGDNTFAEAGGGDMVKLSTSSLSTASSWYSDSLDSTYYAYKIIVNIVSISNQYAKVYARLRASGSDLTGSNYTWHIHGAFRYTNNSSGNGEYNDGYAGGSEWKPHGDGGLDTDTGEGVDMIIDLINPSNTVGYKGGFCNSRFLYDSARWYTTHSTFKYAAQAAYTGFKLYTTAGTMTGTVNLYGIK